MIFRQYYFVIVSIFVRLQFSITLTKNYNLIIFLLLALNQAEKNYVFQVKSTQIKGTQVVEPTCQSPVSTQCQIDCSNDIIMASISKIKGNIFESHQFWEFFIILTLFTISQLITWSLQDPICLDLLGDCTVQTILFFISSK